MTDRVSANLLVVDDDADTVAMMVSGLRRHGFETDAVRSGEAALEYIAAKPIDVVVTDVTMGRLSGIALCQALREHHPEVLSIVVTGQGNLDIAIAAIRAGAYDFITKPITIDALLVAINRAVDYHSVRREVQRLRGESGRTLAIDGIIGDSQPVRAMIELIHRVASSDATVLLSGESGTGKELAARAIHALSSRASQPFVAVNCAAMPAPLLESELFGHVRGAFTDAKRARPGLFAQAASGTLLLDEIGEMPLEMQVKLLRVLQERTVRPVGADIEIPFEARVIAATNRDLESEVYDKRFREDLYYRINVVAIGVPPLRARGSDVLSLAQNFLQRIAGRAGKAVEGISPEAARKLVDYDWPGNVRELENCVERAVALCRLNEIIVDDLPDKVRDHLSTRMVIATDVPEELITLAEMERRYVRRVLAAVGGNKTHAARILGIDRRSLYRRLDPDEHGDGSGDAS